MSNVSEHPTFLFVAFGNEVIPPFFDAQNPGAAAIRLAGEKYGFKPHDFNPKHTGRFYGPSKFGYTFEVHVKWDAAQFLITQNDLSVISIFD